MATNKVEVKLLCKHCSDPIPGAPFTYKEEVFCCMGCKTVYEVLDQNNLCDYYDLADQPGFSLRSKTKEQYEYLDEQIIIDRLVSPISPSLALVILTLPQIHCSSCVWLLEKLYKFHEGIFSSKVDFMRKEVEIRYNPSSVSLRRIVETLDMLGYKPQIDIEQKQDRSHDEKLKIKIGVAGFSFGNIMLFSFPEYLGLEDAYFKLWFGYLNLALSLPVVFYAGSDYLVQAWYSLKFKTYNINIPLALGIVVMLLTSIYQVTTGTGAGYIDSLSGLVFFLLIGKWYQQRSYHYLSFERDYRSYFPISTTRFQNGQMAEVSIENINEGDELLIKNNQIIPVDGILVSDNTSIDYSFVTGEENAIVVLQGEKIFAGGKLRDRSMTMVASRKVKNSYLVSLWNDAAFHRNEDVYQTLTDRLSRYFTLAILLVALAGFVHWVPASFDKAIKAFTSVLIVACPCAIALTGPFLYGNMLRLLSRRGIFLRNSQVIDKAAGIRHLVFDKTGTVTTQLEKELYYHGKVFTDEERRMVHALAFQSVHPLSMAIEKTLRDSIIEEVSNFYEVDGKGVSCICRGHLVKMGSAAFLGLPLDTSQETRVQIAIDNKVLGYFVFRNQYRDGFAKVVTDLRSSGMGVSLLSGDNDKERQRLEILLGSEVEMRFNHDPHQKMHYIQSLQQKNKVAMVGDGLNDSGALKQSDLGIVVTEGTNNFTPASDIIFKAEQFSDLASFFQLSRNAHLLIGGAYLIAVLYNVIGLNYAIRAELSPVVAAILMPLSSLTIVGYTVLSSGILVRRMLGGMTKIIKN
ncbi:MAG: heavy metal translocating P-type ATPase metal-binding domain-containing protein [Saprospiraceae bacterium]|nr:heavy metal translocating P-type ATPase metal-binding domain-containing protein [Saprospiraceae bacterium]